MLARLAPLAVLCTILAGPAHADGEILDIIKEADSTRLDRYEATRETALAEARDGGAPADVAVLEEVVARPALSFADFDMTGAWQCRMEADLKRTRLALPSGAEGTAGASSSPRRPANPSSTSWSSAARDSLPCLS